MIFESAVELTQRTKQYTVKNNSELVPAKLQMNYNCCF